MKESATMELLMHQCDETAHSKDAATASCEALALLLGA
jgi:hypothetical protein